MENNKNNKFVIRKVPLYSLINLLNSLYQDGADYVDLYREIVNEEQDSITVSVPMHYMSKDALRQEGEEGEPQGPPPDELEEENDENEYLNFSQNPLTDNDLKNLMDNA